MSLGEAAVNVAVIAPRDEPSVSKLPDFFGNSSRVKRSAHHAER